MAKPISCKSGFKSFPSSGDGNILTKGLDVNKVKSKNPKFKIPKTPITLDENMSGKFLLNKQTSVVHIDSIKIHNNNEPSWAPQTADTLNNKGSANCELLAT